jgi:phosphoserine phosphatase RsbU/P
VGELAVAGLGPEVLTAALEALPDGVVIFDAQWTVCFINPAGAALVGRRADELTGRTIWAGLPELTGTIFHSFLLHARGAGRPVTWRGFYAPAGRWLSATAVVVGELLQVSIREVTSRLAEPVDGAQPDQADDNGDRDRLQFLAEVSETLITTLDAGKSAAQLTELAVSRLCDWAVVSLIGEEGAPGEEAWAHHDPGLRADLDTYMTQRLRGTGDDEAMVDALMSGQPVQMIPVREDLVAPSLPTEEVRAAWRRLQTASYTIVPLRARGETFGALVLLNSGDRPPHTEAEIATAVEVARRGALALDNARLYGRQLKVAETLQRSLLTPPPQPDDLQIAVRYRPAGAYQQVGGDWYDAFQQPDGATLLVIGDVVGHNVDAAAAMGQIRSILRGLACDRPESPARILSRVDRVLTTLGVPTLATALLARIEQPADLAAEERRRLRWSSAGHLPPLLLRPDGVVQQLDSAPERLLGSGSACARSDQEVLLSPGDTVVFYTDGLIEYGRTGIDEGIDRLGGQLAELADLPLEDLCDGLLSGVPTGRADDDIAVLALRCGPARHPGVQANAAGSSDSDTRAGRSASSAPDGRRSDRTTR